MSERRGSTRAEGAKRGVPVRVHRLGEEPPDDLSAVTTPAERLAMVWELSARTWALTARPVPADERRAMPRVVVRPGDTREDLADIAALGERP